MIIVPVFGVLLALAVPPVPEGERARLDGGEVVVKPRTPADDEGSAVLAYAVVKAPVEKVWPALRDCDRYAEFMPRANESALRSGTPENGVCYVEVSLPFPLSNLWAENTSTGGPIAGGGFERRWKLLRGTYKKNTGVWRVVPWGAAESLVVYELEVAPDTVLPDSILRKAQGGALPDVFTAIRRRAGASK